jgi:hypothetical protein
MEADRCRAPAVAQTTLHVHLPRRVLPPLRRSQHDGHARLDLPERQVPVLVPIQHVPRPLTGGHVDRVDARVLVHPEVLEDPHETHVRGYERRNDPYPALGHDRHLDDQVRLP